MLQDVIGPEVRAELGRQDISIEALAKALGWTDSRLRRRLKGQVPWAVEDVEAIASVLDVPRSQFLDPPVQYRRTKAS